MVSSGDPSSHIGADPFATPAEQRELTRQLRGRLVAPVTVWTAGPAERPAGITVSSVLVAEGSPPEVVGLIDPLSDFWEATCQRQRFLVHVLAASQVRLAEKFALHLPVAPFEGEQVVPTPWGPAIAGVTTRAGCTLTGSTEAGYGLLVRGRLDDIVLGERGERPLAHYRGGYLATAPLRG